MPGLLGPDLESHMMTFFFLKIILGGKKQENNSQFISGGKLFAINLMFSTHLCALETHLKATWLR